MQRALQRSRARIQLIAAELERIAREDVDTNGRPGIETTSRRVTALASELEDLAQGVMRATAKDDLSSLQGRLGNVLTLLRQVGGGIAEIRGDKSPVALLRPQTGGERHDSVREEAELIANTTDALWTEVVAMNAICCVKRSRRSHAVRSRHRPR